METLKQSSQLGNFVVQNAKQEKAMDLMGLILIALLKILLRYT